MPLAALMLGVGFLYAPIALLVLYSFNASRLVTVWAGFSTRWYGALLHDEAFGAAALTSLEVAAMAASGVYGKTKVCAGIVGYADLALGGAVEEVLEAQIAAGGGAGIVLVGCSLPFMRRRARRIAPDGDR